MRIADGRAEACAGKGRTSPSGRSGSPVAFARLRFGAGLLTRLARARRDGPAPWPPATDRAKAFLERIDAMHAARGAPFATMLALAGWTRERLAQSVGARGLEATLVRLADDGVRLDADEVKCRVPLARAGRTIAFSPVDLDCAARPSVPLGTSGTSGPRTKNAIDLDGFELQASYMRTMLDAIGGLELPLALYYPAPSAAGIAHMLSFALAGKPPDAWFCHLPEATGAALPWSRWLRMLVVAARTVGVRLPLPALAEVERPDALVDWLRAHACRGAVLATFPGSALRLAAYAEAAGRPLPPTTFILGGEPVTARKRALLESRGHRVYPWYGAVDAGRIAIGCTDPAAPDDMHLLADRFAAIERDGRLLLTSLSPSVHKLYLNVDGGDLARLERRSCGCPIGRLGFDWHVSDVRSVQKLCVEGITLPADLVHRLADEMLPAACGGTPADYQLAEEEGDDGWTRLVVRVAPGIAAPDERAAATVLDVIVAAAHGMPDVAERIRRAGVVVVRREAPRFSPGGKLLAAERP
ncbi:hypothetical protein BURK1_00322 [Burkholderiales bacterium]|nr:hypothetical protein BURK1_00322 [Burkholderiales bacterium]